MLISLTHARTYSHKQTSKKVRTNKNKKKLLFLWLMNTSDVGNIQEFGSKAFDALINAVKISNELPSGVVCYLSFCTFHPLVATLAPFPVNH